MSNAETFQPKVAAKTALRPSPSAGKSIEPTFIFSSCSFRKLLGRSPYAYSSLLYLSFHRSIHVSFIAPAFIIGCTKINFQFLLNVKYVTDKWHFLLKHLCLCHQFPGRVLSLPTLVHTPSNGLLRRLRVPETGD